MWYNIFYLLGCPEVLHWKLGNTFPVGGNKKPTVPRTESTIFFTSEKHRQVSFTASQDQGHDMKREKMIAVELSKGSLFHGLWNNPPKTNMGIYLIPVI